VVLLNNVLNASFSSIIHHARPHRKLDVELGVLNGRSELVAGNGTTLRLDKRVADADDVFPGLRNPPDSLVGSGGHVHLPSRLATSQYYHSDDKKISLRIKIEHFFPIFISLLPDELQAGPTVDSQSRFRDNELPQIVKKLRMVAS